MPPGLATASPVFRHERDHPIGALADAMSLVRCGCPVSVGRGQGRLTFRSSLNDRLRSIRRRHGPRQRRPHPRPAARLAGLAETPTAAARTADAGQDAEGGSAAGVAGGGKVGLGVTGMAVIGAQAEGGCAVAEGEVEVPGLGELGCDCRQFAYRLECGVQHVVQAVCFQDLTHCRLRQGRTGQGRGEREAVGEGFRGWGGGVGRVEGSEGAAGMGVAPCAEI